MVELPESIRNELYSEAFRNGGDRAWVIKELSFLLMPIDHDPALIGTTIYLITPEEYDRLPDSVELISIHGQRRIKGKQRISQDTRYGKIAWGLEALD